MFGICVGKAAVRQVDVRSNDSDDDFVNPPKRSKITKSRGGIDEHKFIPISAERIRNRTTPKHLMELIKILTEDKIKAVEEIGFASILRMKLHSVPTILGHWLLSNYDHNTNMLNVGTHRIEITKALVHEVLGIPMSDVEVKENSRPKMNNEVVKEWREQFGINSELKTVTEVITQIKGSDDHGRLFKLNFMVVFNTTMCYATKGTKCNLWFLPSMTKSVDIATMDWCGYVVNCLKRTKMKWSGKEHYNGPLPMLAVRVIIYLI
jgi:hypothetical protein